MIASYRLKLHLTIVVFMLFLTVSCNVPPYVQEPTATPEPTAIPVGPYIVAVKDSGSKTMISDPVFWVGANRIKKSDIVFDGNGYHLFCNTGERLSIWADGFFIKQIVCQGETAPVEIFLDRYQLTDNANYVWTGSNACAACHTDRTDELTGRYHNEYSEWLSDPHSKSYANPFFQSIYLGTNGPPGFLSDYPADFGNCAFCHVPAVLDPPQREADLRNFFFTQPSPATEGVTCDVCHKVVSVNLQASG